MSKNFIFMIGILSSVIFFAGCESFFEGQEFNKYNAKEEDEFAYTPEIDKQRIFIDDWIKSAPHTTQAMAFAASRKNEIVDNKLMALCIYKWDYIPVKDLGFLRNDWKERTIQHFFYRNISNGKAYLILNKKSFLK